MQNKIEVAEEMNILIINKQKAGDIEVPKRTLILFDDDIYIPVELVGETESTVLKLAEKDSIECLNREGQYYAPLSWLEIKYSKSKALFNGIRVEVSRRYTSTEFFE